MEHMRTAKMRPKGRESGEPSGELSAWLSFRAGNLKKMKRKREPSKKQEVRAKTRMRRSVSTMRRGE